MAAYPKSQVRRRVCAALTLSLLSASLYAQSPGFPNRPLRYINPNAAGLAADIVARAFAARMSENLGQTVFVDNRPGAGSTLGAMEGAKAAPDGYTMTQTSSPLFAVVPQLYTKLSFDPVKDFRSLIVLASFQNVLVVNPSLPVRSVSELIALARKEPKRLTYGSTGNGTTTHLSGELFKQLTGVEMVHVPYRSGANALTDLLSGQTQLMFSNAATVLPHIKTGGLRALAVTSNAREAALPDVPTMIETGLKDYQAVGWHSVSVPAATPQAVVDVLSAAAIKAVNDPAFRKTMVDNGFVVVGGTPEQMDRMRGEEIARWGPVVKSTGVKID